MSPARGAQIATTVAAELDSLFPVTMCHQRVVTRHWRGGPREGLRGRRSEDRLRTPLPWRRQYAASSLWKTLGFIALQARAPIDVNTRIRGDRGGGGRERRNGPIPTQSVTLGMPSLPAHSWVFTLWLRQRPLLP